MLSETFTETRGSEGKTRSSNKETTNSDKNSDKENRNSGRNSGRETRNSDKETRNSDKEIRNRKKKWNKSFNGSPANVPVNATQSSSQTECRALGTGSWQHLNSLNGRLKIHVQSCWAVALVCVHCRWQPFGLDS